MPSKKTPRTLVEHIRVGGMHYILWCHSTVHLCSVEWAMKNNPAQTGTRHKIHHRLIMSVKHIIQLQGFCLHSMYFLFQGQFFEWIEGGSHGVPNHSNICYILYGSLWVQSPLNHREPTQIMIKICGWHLCHTKSRTWRDLPTAH